MPGDYAPHVEVGSRTARREALNHVRPIARSLEISPRLTEDGGMASTAPKTSNAPLVLSVLALPTFLLRLGLVGAWLGYRQVGRAKQPNQRPRWQSRAAVVLGLLSVVDTVALGAWMRHSNTQKMGQVGGALARAATGREQVSLTGETAC